MVVHEIIPILRWCTYRALRTTVVEKYGKTSLTAVEIHLQKNNSVSRLRATLAISFRIKPSFVQHFPTVTSPHGFQTLKSSLVLSVVSCTTLPCSATVGMQLRRHHEFCRQVQRTVLQIVQSRTQSLLLQKTWNEMLYTAISTTDEDHC